MSGGTLLYGWSWLCLRRRSAGPARHRRDRTRPAGARRWYPVVAPAVPKPHVVAMADARTMVSHLITQDAVTAGRQAGRYAGVCGAIVLPGSLREDTDRYCRSCQQWAAAQ